MPTLIATLSDRNVVAGKGLPDSTAACESRIQACAGMSFPWTSQISSPQCPRYSAHTTATLPPRPLLSLHLPPFAPLSLPCQCLASPMQHWADRTLRWRLLGEGVSCRSSQPPLPPIQVHWQPRWLHFAGQEHRPPTHTPSAKGTLSPSAPEDSNWRDLSRVAHPAGLENGPPR